jgi:type II secretion system protein G
MRPNRSRVRSGFTLIELLIVVAIIAILAAIAVPNFLEAQTRSKVSRAVSDLRSLATAIEAYRVDTNKYPPCKSYWTFNQATENPLSLWRVTTPVAYIATVPYDPFPGNRVGGSGIDVLRDNYLYHADHFIMVQQIFNPTVRSMNITPPYVWSLVSYGPDRKVTWGEALVWGDKMVDVQFYSSSTERVNRYDATNGTISDGDVVRLGP